MVKNVGNISFEIPPVTFQGQGSVTIKEVIDAMEVIGFQDQGKEKVAEFIQDKFQDLTLGTIDMIPSEFIEQADSIMSVVEYLVKIAT